MESKTPSVPHQSTGEMQCLLFGDFSKDEYGRYFQTDIAVKFVNDPTAKKTEIVATNNAGKEEEHHNQTDDIITSWADHVEDHFAEDDLDNYQATFKEEPASDSKNDKTASSATISLTNKKEMQKEISVETLEEGMQQQSVKEKETVSSQETEKRKLPKQKPINWAALFKSDSPSAKATNIISVQVEQDVKKETFSAAIEQDEASKVVPIKNDSKARALADFLHKSSLHFESIHLQLRGLINNGNWCYINATLQSLLGCSAFYHLFKSMVPFKQKLGAASSTPLTDTMIAFFNEFSTLDHKAMNHKGKKNDEIKLGSPFEPKQVYEILSVFKTTLSETGKQQDAEEFLTFLLNGLHEEFLSLNSLVPNIASTNNSKQQNEKLVNGNVSDRSAVIVDSDDSKDGREVGSTDDWEHVGRNNKSANLRQASDKETLITKLFGGIIRSSVHHAGAKESASLQPFFTIQLDIQAENIWNIKDAFENYFTKENLEGFTSSKTNSKVEASHKTSLEKLPRILILHLKYFVYDKTGGCQKSHKAIEIEREMEIPTDVLSPSLKGRVPANNRTYGLFAIEFHHGKNAAGGHYTTAVKHKDPLGWVYCNDNTIQKTQFSQIFKHHKEKVPYLLFYERINASGI